MTGDESVQNIPPDLSFSGAPATLRSSLFSCRIGLAGCACIECSPTFSAAPAAAPA
eukprot:CAMPEP_0202884398 /NCGR_PEP_ID=MMETSP1391-20130828/40908_1 /ASSEMBLY_ACC=CAM_ASM_000867 /TAXON_ID=1034604 /ORGANISM="Chlamydomonas leiostraca, Strain SAG 11-49" /LENGTH=55 /DNA_ID=CAMNT_0049567583 /DNA_START=411 /DNA_END=574 /DNA_ORIENTATION=+